MDYVHLLIIEILEILVIKDFIEKIFGNLYIFKICNRIELI